MSVLRRRQAVQRHLRRYPWWYGIATVWLLAMLALPVVRLDPLDVLSHQDTAAGPQAPGDAALPLPAPSIGAGAGSVGGPTDPTAPAATTVTTAGATTVAPTSSTTAPGALELVPPELLDLVFDAIPQLVLPTLPPELAPITRALAPLAATGCSGIGLASVVIAVVAQSAEGVPVQRILPYLSPLSTLCAGFPIPLHHTVCAADAPFVIDLAGLTSTPPILGLGIDQIEATQVLISQGFGQALPDLAGSLRAQLDCTVT